MNRNGYQRVAESWTFIYGEDNSTAGLHAAKSLID
jgi:hypothetical protein